MQLAILNLPVLILPIVVPVIFWAAYHYHKDRHLPEPPLNLLLCFALGIMAAGASRLMYIGLEPFGLRFDAVALGIDDPLGLLAYALLAIGPIEEFAKLLPFLFVVLRFKALDEPLDGIIYASFLGLGYAAAENMVYLEFCRHSKLLREDLPVQSCTFCSRQFGHTGLRARIWLVGGCFCLL